MISGNQPPIVIRSVTSHDELAVRRINRSAFGTDAEANLVDALRSGGHSTVELVATAGETIVGHILFSRLEIHTSDGTVDSISLAPMSVAPQWQRLGIGSRLVEDGLKACRTAGHASILVLGHPKFYPRFGFSAELARRLTSPFGGGQAWMGIELIAGALSDVAGHVEFSPPFLALNEGE